MAQAQRSLPLRTLIIVRGSHTSDRRLARGVPHLPPNLPCSPPSPCLLWCDPPVNSLSCSVFVTSPPLGPPNCSSSAAPLVHRLSLLVQLASRASFASHPKTHTQSCRNGAVKTGHYGQIRKMTRTRNAW